MTNIIQLPVKNEWRNKELLYQKYVVERRSLNELAVEFKVARQTISKQMKEFGISVRKSGANVERKRGLAYGEKCRDRKLKVHKREMENIQKMKDLRDKGFSYWKIADIFNSMAVPTKTRKGKWHAKTIHQILLSSTY
ncbi:MAG: recombinase family protein [Bacteriovoracaceae bacterium]